MSEHPEFPQETPAMKYLIEQVSKIEDAQACGTGYYKSLSKVLSRLDKTDTTLTQLQTTTEKLRKVTDSSLKVIDSSLVATILGQKVDEINNTLWVKMEEICAQNINCVSSGISRIEDNNKELNKAFARALIEIENTNKRLKSQIASVDSCLVIPSWKAGALTILLFCVGVYIGKVI